MSVVGLLGGIAGFVKVRYLHDKAVIDNPIFRLHYKVTAAVFFATCILITAFDFFGKPIDCVNDAFPRQDALNTYCWVQSTFTLPNITAGPYHGIGPETPGSTKRYHSFYQWVPFVLFLQGILFYLPHWIWKQFEDGKIKNMTDGHRGQHKILSKAEERKAHCSILTRYLMESIGSHGTLALSYIVCETLNFINCLANIFFIDKFLGGVFLTYGSRIVQFSNEDQEDRTDPMIEVFPRMTKCTFQKYGSSGTIQNHDALCLLPLNIVHEKIYIFLWFWLIILTVLSALAVVYRLVTILKPSIRLYAIRNRGAGRAVVHRIPYGDYFLIHLLGKNLQGFTYDTLIEELAHELAPAHRDFPTAPSSYRGYPHDDDHHNDDPSKSLVMADEPTIVKAKFNIID